MAAYRYSAVDPGGREQAGVLEADNARAARQLLRSRGLVALSVQPVLPSGARPAAGSVFARRLSQTELSVLTRQLSSLLNAALPVADTAYWVDGYTVPRMATEGVSTRSVVPRPSSSTVSISSDCQRLRTVSVRTGLDAVFRLR